MTYSEKLQHPKWQKKRLEILKRDKFKCKLCSDEETQLQIHHKEYIKGNEPWDYPNTNFVALCKHCHIVISEFSKEYPNINFKNIKATKTTKKGKTLVIMYLLNRLVFTEIKDGSNEGDIRIAGTGKFFESIMPLINHAIKNKDNG